ncbi:asparaginase [Carboxydothermus hydrogenoformans]|uniref:Putative asparaginase n=1 Tax=Carboxydothermus hydrogenoformans (strain ATCC BAA-161 / DSM 6008 / Z-2901) TaxID=246194 RepID=Q3AE00_CARHZ|nr:asparaginase [Carboxydothermus hydrogenoformans]ABB14864.1 putative asparaginase [Carboxydothermus hydrogenoformans Z-2901]
MNFATDYTLLAEVTRGDIVESVHFGSIAVVDYTGKIVASAGNPELVTFLRSSAKPIQVLPLLVKDLPYDFSAKEIAVMCASHSGTVEHTQTVAGILQKIGLDEGYLSCGTHEPFDRKTALWLKQEGLEPSPLYNNCSGKHAGMLALAKVSGYPLTGYEKIDHPVQQEILKFIADFTEVSPENIKIGIDGCGVPVFAVPLKNGALAFAKLSRPDLFSGKLKEAVKTVLHSMNAYPVMVAGTGRFDTDLMGSFPGRFVSKIGAEAVQIVGILNKGIAVAVKVADGNARALGAITLEALRQLGFIGDEELKKLATHYRPVIKNHKKEMVGEIKANFTLTIH